MQATHRPSPVLVVLGGHPLRLCTWAGQAPSPRSTCAASAEWLPLESRSSRAAPEPGPWERGGGLAAPPSPHAASLLQQRCHSGRPCPPPCPRHLSGSLAGVRPRPPASMAPTPARSPHPRRCVHSAPTPGPGPGGADNSCLRPAAPQTKAGPPGGPAPRPPPPVPETEPPPGTKFLPTCLSSAGIGPGAGGAGRRRRRLDRDRLRCLGRSARARRTRSRRADLAERRLAADGRGGATRRAANRAEPSWGGGGGGRRTANGAGPSWAGRSETGAGRRAANRAGRRPAGGGAGPGRGRPPPPRPVRAPGPHAPAAGLAFSR